MYCECQLQKHAQHGLYNLGAKKEDNWIIYQHEDQGPMLSTTNLVYRSTVEAAGTTLEVHQTHFKLLHLHPPQTTRRLSQATSGSWRMSRPPTTNTVPSPVLHHRPVGGWGSAPSVWWRRRTSPWPTPGQHWTKGIKLLPSATHGTGDFFPPSNPRFNRQL